MKNLKILLLLLLLGSQCGTQARNRTNGDQVITVTDAQGRKESIALPEGMTIETDSLLNLYHSQNYLHEDTAGNHQIYTEITGKSEYIDRLKRLPTVIEMPYNDIVEKFIELYTGERNRTVSYLLGASNFYIPIFEQALETYQLPLELKYLPFIESALDPYIFSKSGKSGLWQLDIETGKKYGLKINSLVDERRDPMKASYAAARYLKDLYQIFDDWELTITAFHCGIGAVNKAIHRSKGSADFWNIFPHLSPEARGYVPAFIATNYIMNNYCYHHIVPMLADLPAKTDTVTVNRDVHFEQITHVLGISLEQLRELNPQYRRDIVNGNNSPMAIRLPASLIGNFIDHEDSIFNFKTDELLLKRTEVETGDATSVSPSLSRSYRSRSRSSRSQSSRTTTRNRRRKTSKPNKLVTVKKGDTLSEIAERNHTTVKKLRRLNSNSGNTIRPGKKIKVK